MTEKSKEYAKRWKQSFKPFGKKGAATGNAIAVEIDGVTYDTLTSAAELTGKSISWIKKNGKIIK